MITPTKGFFAALVDDLEVALEAGFAVFETDFGVIERVFGGIGILGFTKVKIAPGAGQKEPKTIAKRTQQARERPPQQWLRRRGMQPQPLCVFTQYLRLKQCDSGERHEGQSSGVVVDAQGDTERQQRRKNP